MALLPLTPGPSPARGEGMKKTLGIKRQLMHAMARLRAAVGAEQIDFLARRRRRPRPSLRSCRSAFRGARLATQITSRPTRSSARVGALDAGEHGAALFAAEAERQLQQLFALRGLFGRHDARHAEIDFGEIVETAFRLQGSAASGSGPSTGADPQ